MQPRCAMCRVARKPSLFLTVPSWLIIHSPHYLGISNISWDLTSGNPVRGAVPAIPPCPCPRGIHRPSTGPPGSYCSSEIGWKTVRFREPASTDCSLALERQFRATETLDGGTASSSHHRAIRNSDRKARCEDVARSPVECRRGRPLYVTRSFESDAVIPTANDVWMRIAGRERPGHFRALSGWLRT
jgi:hypothetical protein